MCNGKSAGNSFNIRDKAKSPPADAPMTTALRALRFKFG
jgi:hypothetical protein